MNKFFKGLCTLFIMLIGTYIILFQQNVYGATGIGTTLILVPFVLAYGDDKNE